jgi:hypothetical protein
MESVPEGFKVVGSDEGRNFYCTSCNRPAGAGPGSLREIKLTATPPPPKTARWQLSGLGYWLFNLARSLKNTDVARRRMRCVSECQPLRGQIFPPAFISSKRLSSAAFHLKLLFISKPRTEFFLCAALAPGSARLSARCSVDRGRRPQ